MNTNKIGKLMIASLTSLFIFGAAQAQETETAGMNHENGMMEKMDMKHMKKMMHECMTTKKDKKTCDHAAMMQKCEKEMGQDDCQKMMKEAMSSGTSTNK